ncbi:hypothetical protein [Bacillus atrophaeus]|uniref:hypothetical protein n=1 Tax=Bacillus atrophaeus TaxID=1452 RepID=UPI001C627E9D|nr:hypothetical protein [Bacillus atrophaeus]QYG88333.1 hypothetical protein HCU65_07520 [Bacillus atrophaeus]
MIELIMKLSAIIATWLAIIKLAIELNKMRKEAKAEKEERRIPTKKHRRRT